MFVLLKINNTVNRIRVELKFVSNHRNDSPCSPVNRTRVELKYNVQKLMSERIYAVNRTRVELKSLSVGFEA